MAKIDHKEHNDNPDYHNILLGDIDQSWDDKVALDFGCGTGRNIKNLFKLANWKRVDGCDISGENLKYAEKGLKDSGYDLKQFKLYENSGEDIQIIEGDNIYDFIMSTIVFTHICVHQTRISLLKDIYRILKPNGLFSFQMSFGSPTRKTVGYFENFREAKSTNGGCDVRLENKEDLLEDLRKIGFTIKDVQIRDSFSDSTHPKWIYVKAIK